MDRGDMEPGHRLHEDQRRLQKLLCGAHGEAVESNGNSAVCRRIQPDIAAGHAGITATLEEAANDFSAHFISPPFVG